jgi:hypothetical protein
MKATPMACEPAREAKATVTDLREHLPSEVSPAAQSFWLWVLETLQLPAQRCGDDCYEFAVPAGQREDFGGREVIRFCWDAVAGADRERAGTPAEVLAVGSPLGDQLLGCLKRLGPVVHAAPRGQPVSVHELAPHLFTPYRVEGGSVRLSGCSLDDQPLLRYTYGVRSGDADECLRLEHIYASPQQLPIEEDLLAALRVNDLTPIAARPPRLPDEKIAAWLAHGERQTPRLAGDRRADFLLTTVIWCKRASGKLLFELGDSSAERSFDLWAQQLVDGTALPPPFRCSATGRESYHLVATDDGRITVADAIARCEHSGRRVLDSELETCAVTGRRVLGEFLNACSVSGEWVLASELVSCIQCGQQVSPHAISGGRCRACRSLQGVTPDDPRLARILGEYPKLDRWPHWQLAETASVYVLTARSLLRRLLLVLDKESLQATRVAEGFRLARQWPEIPPAQWDEFLG